MNLQFVQLRHFLPPHRCLTEEDLMDAKDRLAKEVLHEVINYFLNHFRNILIYYINKYINF